MTLLLGAVAYDPKVVSIWTGFRSWLRRRELPIDFVLYSNYERQTEDLLAGRIHLAWNSPLAWIRAERLARVTGRTVRPLVMRDSDQDLTSVVVARADTPSLAAANLHGATIAVGALDSPQATMIPLSYLRAMSAAPGADMKILRHDVSVGLHGDHIGGEREAAHALLSGAADAACMLDATHLMLTRDGTFPPGAVRLLAQTPPYDHCNMTVVDTAPPDLADRFGELLLGMSYSDPEVRPLLDLEGLRAWRPGRDTGYAALSAAVDEEGFYDAEGGVIAIDYRP
jgi:ABC-type phosphate/phosphonate transport system substrate-binding protein